jgi:hypothetical protein
VRSGHSVGMVGEVTGLCRLYRILLCIRLLWNVTGILEESSDPQVLD